MRFGSERLEYLLRRIWYREMRVENGWCSGSETSGSGFDVREPGEGDADEDGSEDADELEDHDERAAGVRPRSAGDGAECGEDEESAGEDAEDAEAVDREVHMAVVGGVVPNCDGIRKPRP